ncbi:MULTISPECIES: alcohol dehydrogenase catalytic domain-containing protein [unclassified Paraburkholderia]|uniref:alcohol dehydrogenase catalytic domain-containing protein n=1 Tax=unclassified Paraburkholderia TaxID=2615204 RepID=UPI002AB21C09|nr:MULTISPECIES: alcohol dehydrogenase catalytic domain-containing protein [unclassified Paraburkholderia]
MKATYRAMQIAQPGILELVERVTPMPGDDEVLLAVEACGICGADIADIDRANPALQPPRVPGHEIVGRIVALGARVPALWKPGQRVGVGRLGGHCNACAQCRRGQFQLCENQPFVGSTCDGGYAEVMVARATALVAIPPELAAEEAAPLLCAGIATFNALRKSGAQAGDTVAVFGIGGLGHLALQYARRMGYRVVAIGRGAAITADVLALGAHVYLDTERDDVVERLKAMGGAQALISTPGHAPTVSALLGALAPQGKAILLGAGKDPLAVAMGPLVVGEHSIIGSITGTPFENEKALDFSVLTGVRPMIETLPLERANEAYQRMKTGDVKFRMVLTVAQR